MSIAESIYLLMFSSGLLGGIGHCAGMCGPVVAAYTLGFRLPADDIRASSLPQLLYNAGRVTTYSVVGGIMGMTGSFAGVVTYIERFQNMTMAVVGGIMIVLGIASAGLISWRVHDAGSRVTAPVSGFISRVIQFVSQTHTPGSVYVIGMATGFIPCGLLYTAYIAAAGAGATAGHPAEGFLKGMAMLFLFGIGTTPALFFIGHMAARKGEWIRKRLYMLSSLMMTAIGVIFIYRAFRG
ncbi:MAG: sulfite exporter TauE/SafE family protein [Nitrospirae bacterium]|nr:sulfite exporter TauE/SafE family protein [Nitrospirota bacterium]